MKVKVLLKKNISWWLHGYKYKHTVCYNFMKTFCCIINYCSSSPSMWFCNLFNAWHQLDVIVYNKNTVDREVYQHCKYTASLWHFPSYWYQPSPLIMYVIGAPLCLHYINFLTLLSCVFTASLSGLLEDFTMFTVF